ncbi:MAG TPA: single-stranded DNA-binding protein [Candidatus Cloacimonas sp.]|jgi:single-strand DNA-binding protein|nr:single-strand DNA-binding protein [Candidatus Cloacimonadota bacterium]HCX72489.1 single-stranded DNA-binding protein [Candidatus Cloacimonas sp.]
MAKELRLPRVNTVILSGRLTRDIELRYTQSGTPVTKLPIAFDRNYKDASGEWQSETSFIDVVVWSKIAERCAQYLHKGSAVLIEGYLQTRTFVDRDNQNRKVVEVVASRVNFLEKEYNDSSNQNYSSSQDSNQMEATTTDDDVPF